MTAQKHQYFRFSLDMLQKGFTINHAALHGYMLNRFLFFSSQKQDYFESQDSLAQVLQISKRTVVSILSDLQKCEYVKSTLVRKGKSFNNVYLVYDKHLMYEPIHKTTKQQKHLNEEPF